MFDLMVADITMDPVHQVSTAPVKWAAFEPSDTIRGHRCIGEHGPEYAPPVSRRGEKTYTAILACGNELLFFTPPVSGTHLYCVRHQTWETCRVIGGLVVGCDDCDWTDNSFGHDSTAASRAVSRHYASGHRSKYGRLGRDSIEWTHYKPKEKK